MSLHEYLEANRILKEDPPFYALIMAAMRKADSHNFTLLRRAFPDIAEELQIRYDAPGGRLSEERVPEENK